MVYHQVDIINHSSSSKIIWLALSMIENLTNSNPLHMGNCYAKVHTVYHISSDFQKILTHMFLKI